MGMTSHPQAKAAYGLVRNFWPVSFECPYSLDLVLYFIQGLNPFRKRTHILEIAWYQWEFHCLLQFLLVLMIAEL